MAQLNQNLVISTQTELLRIPLKHILYIKGDGYCSNIHMTGGEVRQVGMNLGKIMELINGQLYDDRQLVRPGKSLIVNLNRVYRIVVSQQLLVLADLNWNLYSVQDSREALQALKKFIEEESNGKR